MFSERHSTQKLVLASNSTSLRLGITPKSCFKLYLTLHSYLVSELLLDGQLAKPILPKTLCHWVDCSESHVVPYLSCGRPRLRFFRLVKTRRCSDCLECS
jgi:hypothetical protein